MTRAQTLHGVERLARRSGRSELAVAQALLALMQQGTPGQPAAHWLAGPGRPALTLALGLDDRLAATARVLARQALLPAYLATLLLGTAGLVAWCQRSAGVGDWRLARRAAAGAAGLGGGGGGAAPADRRIAAARPPAAAGAGRRHPGRAPRAGGGAGAADRRRRRARAGAPAAAAPPGQPGTPRAVRAAGRLAPMPPPNTCPATPRCWRWRCRRWRALNAAHGNGDGAGTALHPAAPAAPLQQQRAALDRLGAQARQARSAAAAAGHWAATDAFVDFGAASTTAADTRYVVTLDADTQLPPGRLRELVGVAAHPLQHAAAGQPPAAAWSPATASCSRAWPRRCRRARSAPSSTGCSPATAASTPTAPPAPRSTRTCSTQGSFSGKGLLHVQAMHARARRPAARRAGAQPRPARRRAAALRRGQRHHAAGRRAVPRRRRRGARAPLDARRLAADPVAAAAAAAGDRGAQPLEDARQPAPLAGGAGVAGCCCCWPSPARCWRLRRRWRWCSPPSPPVRCWARWPGWRRRATTWRRAASTRWRWPSCCALPQAGCGSWCSCRRSRCARWTRSAVRCGARR